MIKACEVKELYCCMVFGWQVEIIAIEIMVGCQPKIYDNSD